MTRRLAYEILERNRGAENLLLFGIQARGDQLGRVMAGLIERIEGRSIPYHPLDVSAFRDDREDLEPTPLDVVIEDRDVILVDDVLFTGRTVRAALDALVSAGRPRSVQLVVLIDRGHREFPIQPDFVGRKIPTKHRERVRVRLGDNPSVDVLE